MNLYFPSYVEVYQGITYFYMGVTYKVFTRVENLKNNGKSCLQEIAISRFSFELKSYQKFISMVLIYLGRLWINMDLGRHGYNRVWFVDIRVNQRRYGKTSG